MLVDAIRVATIIANLHHTVILATIAQSRGGGVIAPELAAEASRFATVSAAIGCSSVPPCLRPGEGDDRCGTRPGDGRRIVPSGAMVSIGGARWIAQSGRAGASSVGLEADGSVSVAAEPGGRAWFDPPRKIRAEFCGIDRFAGGAPIRVQFSLLIEPSTTVEGLDWASVFQIHQANMRYDDGSYVSASPLLSIELSRQEAGDVLIVRGETARDRLRVTTITERPRDAVRAATFAPRRELGRTRPLARGAWHRIDLRAVDAHGGTGALAIAVDGQAVVEEPAIAMGYGYVDDLATIPFAGGRQRTGSYVKFGIYGGKFSGDEPQKAGPIRLRYKDIFVQPPD